MSTLFFTFLSILIAGVVLAIVNFILGIKGKNSMGGLFIVHGIAVILYIVGFLGSLITGIIWALQYMKS